MAGLVGAVTSASRQGIETRLSSAKMGLVMKKLFRVAIISWLGLCAAHAEDGAAKPSDLIGSWDVQLFFSENAPPSSTRMIVTEVEDGDLAGTFYASPFLEGRVSLFENQVIFTVVTEDRSGSYYTSGRLEDGVIEGQTLSAGRDFLMAWRATASKN